LKILSLVFTLLPFFGICGPPLYKQLADLPPPIAYQHYVLVNQYFGVSWSIEASNQTISIQLSIPTQAWVGVGFHQMNSSDKAMNDADIITAIWTNSTFFTVDDRWSPLPSGQPPTDSSRGCTYDILNNTVSGFQNSSITLVRFARKLNTGDQNCDQPIEHGTTNVIVAYGTSNNFNIHKEAVLFPLDLFGSSSTTDITSSTTGAPTGSGETSSTSNSGTTTDGTSNSSKNVNIVIAIGVFVFVVSIANLIAAAILMRKRSNARSKVVIIESSPLLTDK